MLYAEHAADQIPVPQTSLMQRVSYVPIVANARSVFATFCELNSPDIASARPSGYPLNRSPGFHPIVANDHSVLATSCELNSPLISLLPVAPAPTGEKLSLCPSALLKCVECCQFLGLRNLACFAE
jgi:hypothetical protein